MVLQPLMRLITNYNTCPLDNIGHKSSFCDRNCDLYFTYNFIREILRRLDNIFPVERGAYVPPAQTWRERPIRGFHVGANSPDRNKMRDRTLLDRHARLINLERPWKYRSVRYVGQGFYPCLSPQGDKTEPE